MREDVVLVDPTNRMQGVEDKIKAHQQGLLHRAFSIFVFSSTGDVLLQKRSPWKYHTPGLWSNTVCGHPKPFERLMSAAHRRLGEEMGFDCRLSKLFSFVYRAKFGNQLTEFEHDTVFIGFFDEEPHPNPAEVAAYRWDRFDQLPAQIQRQPNEYTVWLGICLRHMEKMNGSLGSLGERSLRRAGSISGEAPCSVVSKKKMKT